MNVCWNKLARRTWHLADAKDQVVGRLAGQLVPILTGKYKPTYAPHVDSGDFVVVVNCSKLFFSGKKEKDKKYYWHTGYPGGLKERSPRDFREREQSTDLLRRAVWGMLPRNKLRRPRISRLLLYPGPNHPYETRLGDKVPVNQLDEDVLEAFPLEHLEKDTMLPKSLRLFDDLKDVVAEIDVPPEVEKKK
eukprot:scaffold1280_cov246-Pinguiococcus_pyrenoidosus.AAC.22